ncbi:probable cold shock protein A [Arthrobacter sp. Hiyo8]|nr:probable cold shock protein A [Arthrobacter sp. Hiyo8]
MNSVVARQGDNPAASNRRRNNPTWCSPSWPPTLIANHSAVPVSRSRPAEEQEILKIRPQGTPRPRRSLRPRTPPRSFEEADVCVRGIGFEAGGQSDSEKEHGRGNRYCQVVQRRKGFRLHCPDDGSADVFAHYSAIASSGYRSLDENQRVQFDVVQGPKGPRRRTSSLFKRAPLTNQASSASSRPHLGASKGAPASLRQCHSVTATESSTGTPVVSSTSAVMLAP